MPWHIRVALASALAIVSISIAQAQSQATQAQPAATQPIRIDGAAAGLAISKLAVETWHKAKKDASPVSLGVSGSAGGMAKLCRGEADIANATRPIAQAELAACKNSGIEFIELPVAMDAITVVVNPKNRFVDYLSMEELRRMWDKDAQGHVVSWSQVSPRFPDTPLKLLGPDQQFEQASTFTEAVLGPNRPVRGDYMSSVEDAVLIQGVARDPNALSYIPYAAYVENRGKLKALPIAPKLDAPAVAPTEQNLARGLYQPLARPLFMYVSVKSLKRPAVREFVQFTLAHGSRLATAAHYAPLADATYRLGLEHVNRNTAGSAWAGRIPIGLSMDEIYKRQAAL